MTAVLIIPGILFPYDVVESALEWAKEYEAKLKVLFLSSDKVPDEDYPYPNDMEAIEEANGTSGKVVESRQDLLTQFQRFISKRANASHIDIDIRVLYRPNTKEIADLSVDADKLFVDRHFSSDDYMFEGFSFNMDQLLQRIADRGISVAMD